MSAQRKRYLQLAANTSEPRDKLFYTLMAEVAPTVGSMARRQVNQVGASIIYDVVLRVAAGILFETAFNLGRGAIDIERLKKDFETAMADACEMATLPLDPVTCTPRLDS